MKGYLTGIFLFLFLGGLRAQTPAKLLQMAEEACKAGDWTSCYFLSKASLEHDSTRLNIRYYHAQASFERYFFAEALAGFSYVANAKDKQLYPDAEYRKAECLLRMGEFKKALQLFSKIEKTQARKNKALSDLAAAAKKNAEALSAMKKSEEQKPVRLRKPINGPTAEYAPFVVDTLLFYAQLKNDTVREILWRSAHVITQKKSKNLIVKTRAPMPDGLLGALCPGKNKNEFFGSWIFNNTGKGALVKVIKTEDTLVVAGKLPLPLNLPEGDYRQPVFQPGQNRLFFSSDLEGGNGGFDIWYSDLSEDGSFSKPMNFTAANSADNELSPFWCMNCQALFFSSDRPGGFGGLDVYSLHTDSAGNSSVSNAGSAINSGYNELYFGRYPSGGRVLFCSNRPSPDNPEACCNDIYALSIERVPSLYPSDTISVDTLLLKKEQQINELEGMIPVSLYFDNDQPDPKTRNTETDKSYDLLLKNYLKRKDEFIMQYSDGLANEARQIAASDMQSFFDDSLTGNFNKLNRFLEKLSVMLAEGSAVTLTLKGYCSPLAATDYNTLLASRRVSSLRNYMQQWNQGKLAPWLSGKTEIGYLRIEVESVGELKASPLVSDNSLDRKGSVFGIKPSLERKIEIIAVRAE